MTPGTLPSLLLQVSPEWSPLGGDLILISAIVDQTCLISIYIDDSFRTSYTGMRLDYPFNAGSLGIHHADVVATNECSPTSKTCWWFVGTPVGADSLWYRTSDGLSCHLGPNDTAVVMIGGAAAYLY